MLVAISRECIGVKRVLKKSLFLGCATSLYILTVPMAMAQESAAEAVEDESDVIIVTATKRDVALQDLAASVSAIDGRALEDSVSFDFADYAEGVPGLSFQGNDAGNGKLIVRGISTDSFNGQLQSTVGVYIDNMPGIDVFIPTSSPDLHMFDVARVEVLRGPQGTLWGSSSLGGAVRIVTNNPNVSESEFRGRVTAGLVEDGDVNYGFDGVANIPLIEDSVALRLTAYRRVDAGYIDAPNMGEENSNKTTVTGGRASLRYEANDRLNIDLTGLIQKIESDDGQAVYLDDPLDAANTAVAEDRVRFNYIPETRDQQLVTGNAVIEYDFGFAEFVSSTTVGFSKLETVTDQTSFASFPNLMLTGGTIFEAGFFAVDRSETFTQEIRLVSAESDSPFSWLIGGFYLDNERELRSDLSVLSNVDLYPSPLLSANETFIQNIDNGRKEWAGFGEVSLRLGRLEATAGVRYFDNEQNFLTDLTFAPFAPGFPPFVTGGDTTTSEDGFTPKFSLAYEFSDDVMVYALASKGFRLGGANQSALGSPFPIPETFDSDTVWNYELGIRSVWDDGRVVFNATGFYIDWTDIQSSFRLDSPPLPPFPFFVNAGSAHSAGAEIELQLRPVERLQIQTALTVLNAEIDSPSSVAGALSTVQAGAKLPGTPNVQASSSIQYDLPVGGTDLQLRFSHRHVGESNFDLVSADTQGGYNVFGVSARAELNDNIAFTLYATNLTDSAGVTSTLPGIAPAGIADRRFLIRPRTIGFSVQADF